MILIDFNAEGAQRKEFMTSTHGVRGFLWGAGNGK